jgi:hypothetical protein
VSQKEEIRLPEIKEHSNFSQLPQDFAVRKAGGERTLQNSRSDPLLRGGKKNSNELYTAQASNNGDLIGDDNLGPIGPASNMNFEIKKSSFTKQNSK